MATHKELITLSDQDVAPARSPAELESLRSEVRQLTNQAQNTLNDGGRLLNGGEMTGARLQLSEAARLLRRAADLTPD